MDKFPKRKTNRLKEYDYSSVGYYYVTICVEDRRELLGEIRNGKMILNKAGQIIKGCWEDICNNFTDVTLDGYCIMPNHVHGIIILGGRGLIYQTRKQTRELINKKTTGMINSVTGMINHAPTAADWIMMKKTEITLGKIVRYFKARAARIINNNHMDNFKWQRLFYDHIIRTDGSLNNIREYINTNAAKWEEDENNMHNSKISMVSAG